jgi:hypothetical protein
LRCLVEAHSCLDRVLDASHCRSRKHMLLLRNTFVLVAAVCCLPIASPSPPFACPTTQFNITALQSACATQATACTTCATELARQYGPGISGMSQPTAEEVQMCVFSLVLQLLPSLPILPSVLACALPARSAQLNAWTAQQPTGEYHVDSQAMKSSAPAPAIAAFVGPTPVAHRPESSAPAPASATPARSSAAEFRVKGAIHATALLIATLYSMGGV